MAFAVQLPLSRQLELLLEFGPKADPYTDCLVCGSPKSYNIHRPAAWCGLVAGKQCMYPDEHHEYQPS